VIRDKWPNFQQAFEGFDVSTVAGYGEPDIERLVADAGIVRNRRKIEATIHNARVMWDLIQKYGSFYAYLRSLDGLDYRGRREELSQRFHSLGPTGVFTFLWCVEEAVPEWEERKR
jgi:DNA-3-methyladenine glycosylase I